jgi:salicylate hydroxylase
MKKNIDKIAILGAGMGGLIAHIALKKQGFFSRIYEKQCEIRPEGMGFILLAEGLANLQELDIASTTDSLGIPLQEYCQYSPQGRSATTELMPKGAVGVLRKNLLLALRRQVQAEAIEFECGLAGFVLNAAGQIDRAILSTGSELQADLYVAADGIYSQARQFLFKNWPVKETAVHEIVGLATGREWVAWAEQRFHKFIDPSGGLAFGCIPVSEDQVVWFMQFDRHRYRLATQDCQSLRWFAQELIGHWAKPIPQILKATDFNRIHLWRPIDMDLVPSFYGSSLVLVGDAAHPLLPFTSQGLSAAMKDGVVLAESLAQHSPLSNALASYSDRQRAHCLPFIQRGREMSQRFLTGRSLGKELLPLA